MPANMEILAPVGNPEMLKAAVFSGANAVYMGLEGFNARKGATNFNAQDFEQAVSFCHSFNVKVYAVLNTIIFENELNNLKNAIKAITKAGADAVIVQDLATAFICKQVAPKMPLHASTQLSCTSLSGALQLKKMGFSRVILARELSKNEIKHITENCGIETEVFVHGAMCMGVSGQCMLSAFLGGRSGNRGECAGTCRLPFTARKPSQEYVREAPNFHLSLKDQSLIEKLSDLQEIGVKSAKIEGRLRTPEYVAASVDSAKKSLQGKWYDAMLLQDIFSRSGFSDGYFTQKPSQDMFGIRLKEDAEKTKKAMPQIREIYRREIQSVQIDAKIMVTSQNLSLTIQDMDKNKVCVESQITLQPTENPNFAESVKKTISKLGGTPFYISEIEVTVPEKMYFPLSELNALKRDATAKLIEIRSKTTSKLENSYTVTECEKVATQADKCFARFENVEQVPFDNTELIEKIDNIILPLDQMYLLIKRNEFSKMVPSSLLQKITAQMPRCEFGDDSILSKKINLLVENNIKSFEINNIGHLIFFENHKDIKLQSGIGLNITNHISANCLYDFGVQYITLLPELSLAQAEKISGKFNTGIIAYGHLPLMTTRACPLHNVTSCEECEQKGLLRDRKNRDFVMTCNHKVRTIHNPVALYMGDRQREIKSNYYILYFTYESKNQVQDVLNMYFDKKAYNTEFTRGLYYL